MTWLTVAGGLFLVSRFEVDTPYLQLIATLMFMAVGMGLTSAPSTTTTTPASTTAQPTAGKTSSTTKTTPKRAHAARSKRG